ncbi:hypothetical protein [Ensifer adhaerens]|uniref:hypothetical protein n=1 Tax=Ensifer adhaerens TaxID=106592 RepID=UPI000CF0752A|nr:hypothetical protein [Ensifer adhaerens]
MERPIYDVANDNASLDYATPTTIPADKREAREWLAAKMAATDVAVTVLPAKEAPKPKAWKPSKRKPANDNRELVSWPLLDKLNRDGRHEDAELVEHYRGLVALMQVEPLQGQDPTRADGLGIEARSSIDDDDVDEAAAKDWPGERVPGGNISYKEERQLVKAPGVSSQARPTDETTVVVMRSMNMRFNDRTLIAQIDMRGVLERLRSAMGPLVAPFEDAVLGGMNFGQVGEARHFKGKQAEAVGKALVMTALDAVREEWAAFRAEQRQAEELAERNVERRRTELIARRIAYLRRAA